LIRESASRGRKISIALDYFSDKHSEARLFYETLYEQTRGRRCIIFTNSRAQAESASASLAEINEARRGDSRFPVHHGSVSASLRSDTERELRESLGPLTAVATATLEMGIDIGALDRVIQIGPPMSVSAFVQRLGRSGRLKGKPEIYFTSIEEQGTWEHPINSLPWDLIKTIATIELYVTEKWIEHGQENPLPASLLVHQTISILSSQGARRPAELARIVLALPAFTAFSAEDFSELVKHLIALGVIEQTDEGELIAGLEAEHLTSHYSFYSVFADNTEYRVIAGNHEIGHINFIPPEGSSIVLGGRYWRVEQVFQREREIRVNAGEPGSRQVWRGSGADLHPRVVQAMRKVLAEKTAYPYLSERARRRLAEARDMMNTNASLKGRQTIAEIITKDNAPNDEMPALEGVHVDSADAPYTAGKQRELHLYVLFPWLGSRGMRALMLIIQNREHRKTLGIKSLSKECDFTINIRSTLPAEHFRSTLAEILQHFKTNQSLFALIDTSQIPLLGKFDPYLPPGLLVRQYAAAMLDAEELEHIFS
jgi:ATP-dependent Lhr-like helicase